MTKKKSKTRAAPALPVQILAIVGYTGFAIPVSIIAIGEFGMLGLALAAFLGWQWTQLVRFGPNPSLDEIVERLAPRADDTPRSSGNASFDAYRDGLLARLETEQRNFEGFLTRLRDARDRSEFDRFMTEREAQTAPRSDTRAA